MAIFIFLGIVLLLGILMIITNEIVFFGIAALCIGMLFIYLKVKGPAAAPVALTVAGIYAIVWGILIITAPIIKQYSFLEQTSMGYEGCIFTEGLAGMFLSIGVYQGIAKAILCREKVSAIYVGAIEHRSRRGIKLYEPKFSYTYKEQRYRMSTGECFGRRKLNRRYQNSKACTVFLNPSNPEVICTRRYPQAGAVLMICLGLLFAWIPFG